MTRKINKEKLEQLYQTAIKHKMDSSVKGKLLVFEAPIYFDKRQYSLKVPRRIFDFIEYRKGDKIRFMIDDNEPNKPKLSVSYERSE